MICMTSKTRAFKVINQSQNRISMHLINLNENDLTSLVGDFRWERLTKVKRISEIYTSFSYQIETR